jgi:hypothetical protein
MLIVRKVDAALAYMRDLWPLRSDYTGVAPQHLAYQVRQIDDETDALNQVKSRIDARMMELRVARERVLEAQSQAQLQAA